MPMQNSAVATNAVRMLLEYIGEDADRDGLKQTPQRVIRSYAELFGGYKIEPEDVLTTFEETCDTMVVLKQVEFYSTCEHHMLPFIGVAHIGYLPGERVVGVSKLARVLDIYARRLQIQERIGKQVVAALMHHLKPRGAGCIIEAKHLCMACRGVQKQQSVMVTSALAGDFFQPDVKQEFLQFCK